MLDQSFKDQISGLFASLKSTYVFQIEVDPTHSSKEELVELLEDVASCSPQVSCTVTDAPGLQFRIVRDGVPSSFVFRAVPNGHEFTSLLLAVLNQEGIGKNLPDEALTRETFFQAGRYNQHIHAPFLLISNGMQHYCCRIDLVSNAFNFLTEIPFYAALK